MAWLWWRGIRTLPRRQTIRAHRLGLISNSTSETTCDIEGVEVSALIGMRDTLARLHPRLILVEVNEETLSRAGTNREQLYAELSRSGYEPKQRIRDGDVENAAFARRE